MKTRKNTRIPLAAALLLAGTLAACDAPTAPGDAAVPGGPSLLLSPACAGTGGQVHAEDTIATVQTWSRANSPHRVMNRMVVAPGGRITISPGAVLCFEPYSAIYAHGGRLVARGRDTAQIVFTARDPARGWWGLQFSNSANGSFLTNVRIEHVELNSTAVAAAYDHPVILDSAVIRRSGRAVSLSTGSSISRSRVDTTTNRGHAAVTLGHGARFQETVVRRAAGVGVYVWSAGVSLLGGRIEGSGGAGLFYENDVLPGRSFRPIRIVGGGGYPAVIPAAALARTYGTPALQDSLLGNARDTLVITGGVLRSPLTLGPRLPVLVTATVHADSGANLVAEPGARLVFGPSAGMAFQQGGRLWSRGSAAAPVLFTAEDPDRGWGGLRFQGAVASASYLTNSRVEHAGLFTRALWAREKHRLVVDSAVIRLAGVAAVLESSNSRISRTRVDTTLNSAEAAVTLASNARLESTLIRSSSEAGIYLASATAVVVSCDVRDSVREGIVMYHPAVVRDCNLVDNGGVGVRNWHIQNADLRGNWWGSTGGPGGMGGDGVAGSAIVSPWRTTPYTLPYVP